MRTCIIELMGVMRVRMVSEYVIDIIGFIHQILCTDSNRDFQTRQVITYAYII